MSPIAGIDVPAAGTHLLIRRRIHPVLVAWAARHSVQPDVRELSTVVDPHVVAGVRAHHVGDVITALIGRREVFREHVGWLDDMVIHTHEDQLINTHRAIIGKRVLTS